nr:hypothetical protein [Tanacetum cinerariifolium]
MNSNSKIEMILQINLKEIDIKEIEAKNELLKAYEQCRDISMDKRAKIENFLKIESELDYEMQSALFRKLHEAKLHDAKLHDANGVATPVSRKRHDLIEYRMLLVGAILCSTYKSTGKTLAEIGVGNLKRWPSSLSCGNTPTLWSLPWHFLSCEM